MKSMTQPRTSLPERPQIETREYGQTDPAPQLWPAASLHINTHNVSHMHIQDDKSSFLAYELGLLSLKAALSTRAKDWPIYSANRKEHQRSEVKAAFREELDSLAPKYAKGPVSENDHVALISSLADRISHQHESSLYKGRFRHGVAQKLVNIHLKYLWAAGVIPEPPHCPIDGIIRDLAGLNYDWTVSDSVAEYEAAIAALRAHAQPRTLATWELQEFRRRAQA